MSYYAQWDAGDLSNWQGADVHSEPEDDFIERVELEPEEFSPSMENYGLSWRDFL